VLEVEVAESFADISPNIDRVTFKQRALKPHFAS